MKQQIKLILIVGIVILIIGFIIGMYNFYHSPAPAAFCPLAH